MSTEREIQNNIWLLRNYSGQSPFNGAVALDRLVLSIIEQNIFLQGRRCVAVMYLYQCVLPMMWERILLANLVIVFFFISGNEPNTSDYTELVKTTSSEKYAQDI